MKIVFISDFYLEQGINGGAEICNNELLNHIKKKHDLIKFNSREISYNDIIENKDNFFIVSNFMFLEDKIKNCLLNLKYVIYEHDHKYVSTNDPSKFVDMLVPQKYLINKEFYKNAIAVLCQSKIHSEVLRKNLLIDNIINLGGNLWSENNLNLLESKLNVEKNIKNSILVSQNKNKGTAQAIEYCKKNNIDFYGIHQADYNEFIDKLSKTENLYFFPQWLESFNRVSVEAKILGCKIITNKLIGAASENWFKLYTGKELINFLKEKNNKIIKVFTDIISNNNYQKYFIEKVKIPKVSLITSLYKSEKYLSHFLEEITKQTVFDSCELIIVNCDNNSNVDNLIKSYCKKFKNIKLIKSEKFLNVHESANLAIKNSTGEFLCFANVDDIKAYNSIEILSKSLFFDSNVDLVYGDCFQTNKINDFFYENLENKNLYEHSLYDFHKNNMIKCLPGPMPMWRKNLHDKYGYFDENLKYAGDWDFWLRCVEGGSKFKKIYEVIGLYYQNPEGLSTKLENAVEKKKEERYIFNKYRNVFSDIVYKNYERYFNEE
jgi:hypothetical protein